MMFGLGLAHFVILSLTDHKYSLEKHNAVVGEWLLDSMNSNDVATGGFRGAFKPTPNLQSVFHGSGGNRNNYFLVGTQLHHECLCAYSEEFRSFLISVLMYYCIDEHLIKPD